MAKHAIIRRPGKEFQSCLSTHPDRNRISFTRAIEQHIVYGNLLKELGIEVITLPPLENHPDACFVEDTVVVHGNKAIIANTRMRERQGEHESIADLLKDYLSVEQLAGEAYLEGGDVIHLDDGLIVGLTSRTNQQGINIMEHTLQVNVQIVHKPSIMHLKSHVTYLKDDWVIGEKEFLKHSVFSEFSKIELEQKEAYASNTLTLDEVVIMPRGYDNAVKSVREQGFEVQTIDTTQFCFCDGALTCLSIIF